MNSSIKKLSRYTQIISNRLISEKAKVVELFNGEKAIVLHSENDWLTCWLDSCSSQGRLRSCQCAWRCLWTSRPDSAPAPGTSLPSLAPAHPPYEECRGTWPHSWNQNKQYAKVRHLANTHTDWLVHFLSYGNKNWFNISNSMPFALDLSCCRAARMSSSPLRPSSTDCVLWPRENQHWRTKQFAGHLSTAWNGSQEDRSPSWDVFRETSVLSGEVNINTDMRAQAGTGASNSYQVCGVLGE